VNARAPHPLLEAWERCWASHPASIAEHWSRVASACTFVPYDAGSIVQGRFDVVAHFTRRYARVRLAAAEWTVRATWEEQGIELLVAELDLVTTPPHGDAAERRAIRFFAAGERDGAHVRLRHVTEAMPAVLVEAIGAYERHASDGPPAGAGFPGADGGDETSGGRR
jgi:hypothetical protein